LSRQYSNLLQNLHIGLSLNKTIYPIVLHSFLDSIIFKSHTMLNARSVLRHEMQTVTQVAKQLLFFKLAEHLMWRCVTIMHLTWAQRC